MLIEDGQLTGYLSATSITDIFYLLKKHPGSDKAFDSLEKLLLVFDVAAVTKTDIRNAMKISLNDFEDSLQLTCAKKSGATHVVSRHKENFNVVTTVKIPDPEEFSFTL